jgi:hypothetical protein
MGRLSVFWSLSPASVVLLKRSFTSFVQFITMCFIFEAVVSGTVFLISSACSLFLYRKVGDFCMFIMYLTTLLKVIF